MEEKKIPDEELVKDIERSTGMPSYWKKIVLDLINRQKEEIERLKRRNGNKIITIDNLEVTIMDLEKQNAELQKQVDELTDKLGKVLMAVKADELLIAKGVEQAVKDTAKEILTKMDCLNGVQDLGLAILDFTHWIEERYGVEVE